MSKTYRITLTEQDDGNWRAQCLEHDIASQGDDISSALENLGDTMKLTFEHCRENNSVVEEAQDASHELWNALENKEDKPLDIGYPCTYIMPPNAKRVEGVITNMRDEDYEWFEQHNAIISAEPISNNSQYVFYADVGVELEDGTLQEAIVICQPTDDSFDVMATLRKKAQELIDNGR